MLEHLVLGAELVFTSFMVPALLVPLVWIGRRLFARPGPRGPANGLTRLQLVYAAMAFLWFAGWVAVRFGLPIELGGQFVGWLSWALYFALNLTLAVLLVVFTGEFGGLPEGPQKDRLFARFLAILVAQPLATAFAFGVLYRIMGLVYHINVPALAGVQEGI